MVTDILDRFSSVKNFNENLTFNDFVNASSLNTFKNYSDACAVKQRLKINKRPVSDPFLIDMKSIWTARDLNVISNELLTTRFTGVLTKLNNGSFVLHEDETCVSETETLVFPENVQLLPSKQLFHFVTLNSLPAVFTQCENCSAFSIPGILATVLHDILIYLQIFTQKYASYVNFFDVSNIFFKTLLIFQNADEKFTESLNNFFVLSFESQNSMLSIFRENVLKELVFKNELVLKNIYDSWLHPFHKNRFKAYAYNSFSLNKDFDETLVLTALTFNKPFFPAIKAHLKGSGESDDGYLGYSFENTKIKTLLNASFLQESSADNVLNANIFETEGVAFTSDVILSSLLSVFSVQVKNNNCKHFLLLPRSLHEFLFSHIEALNSLFLRREKFEVLTINSALAGDFTPDMLENFVALWNEKDDASFISMWEVAKTV